MNSLGPLAMLSPLELFNRQEGHVPMPNPLYILMSAKEGQGGQGATQSLGIQAGRIAGTERSVTSVLIKEK